MAVDLDLSYILQKTEEFSLIKYADEINKDLSKNALVPTSYLQYYSLSKKIAFCYIKI